MKFEFLFLLLLSLPAHAFRLSPMVVDFSPSGKGSTQTLMLDNPGKERVAVEIEVVKRKIDVNGLEDRKEPAKDFSVFPEQLTLEPGQKRNIRVTWTGDQAPTTELPFRLVASQLPVTLNRPTNRDDVKVNLKFVLQYVASLYVVPNDAKSHVVVSSVGMGKDGQAEVLLKNDGKSRRVLEKAHIKLIGEKDKFEIPEKALEDVRAQNILAGGSRKFSFAVPKGFHAVKAELSFD
ncbi:MAG: fimbrial biogenesis chaperone [Bdellovibrionota bacterium]